MNLEVLSMVRSCYNLSILQECFCKD